MCIPIIFGLRDSLKPDTSQPSHVCARCRNNSVFYTRHRKWFELFWVPLVPVYWKHIYACNVCGWRSPTPPQSGGSIPLSASQGRAPGTPYGGFEAPNRPGYQPTYMHPASSATPPPLPPASTKPKI
ncbi:hypothetical protein BKA70DRAFT_1248122 [Coprinopsis sp. MPI-PUGE-AT-0042]|nr:hypothetical protein BKA70DRAFT_1248122 [Coprinopsis sp. MPI-PUGE-AT-0042]